MAVDRLDPRLTKERAALVLFDVLQGYLHPTTDPGKKAALEAADTVKNLQSLLEAARRAGLRVFYAAADHAADGSDSGPALLTDTDYELRPWTADHRPTRHSPFVHGQREAQVADELTPRPEDLTIHKHRWSAFYQTSLELALRTRGIDTVVLAGLSTDVGVVSTAFAARDLDFALVIVRDACFANRGPNHDFLMDRIFPRMARVMSTAQAIALM